MVIRLRDDDLTWQEIDDEIVVLDLRSSHYFVINGSGAHLWRMIVEPQAFDDLVSSFADRYGLPSSAAVTDVRAFVRDLHDRGLLAP